MHVALVSMPWAATNEPSMALSLLKALAARDGHVARVLYLNLDMAYRFAGRPAYDRFSAVGLGVGEWLFRETVFGPEADGGAAYREYLSSRGLSAANFEQLEELKRHVPAFLEACVTEVDWEGFDVVGFSMVFAQSLPAVALARRLKQRWPKLTLVCGGANCDGEMGEALHRAFPVFDYLATGEADRSFPALLRYLQAGREPEGVPGLWYRRGRESVFTGAEPPFRALDDLPTPDYDDWFEASERLDTPAGAREVLWLEGSRGCWWGQKSHCSFCSLNDATIVQRNKSARKLLAEIEEVAARHSPRMIKFADNIMPLSHFDDLLPELARLDLDLLFFYEMKANLKREQVRRLARANVRMIQAGIESLNTRKLQLMKKGSSAIQNIQLLKWAVEDGVLVYWNWLYDVPGESDEDLATELATLQMVTHLYPPTGAGPIVMERFAPYSVRPADFGLRLAGPEEPYRHAFALDEALLGKLAFSFEAEREPQAARPAREAVERVKALFDPWRRAFEPQRLYYERGLGTTTITDRRFNHPQRAITLSGVRSEIYRYCDEIRSLEQVRVRAEEETGRPWDPEEAAELLQELVELALMYREGKRYLSLAVRYEPRHHIGTICRRTLRESLAGQGIAD